MHGKPISHLRLIFAGEPQPPSIKANDKYQKKRPPLFFCENFDPKEFLFRKSRWGVRSISNFICQALP